MEKEFGAKFASMLDKMEDLKKNFDYVSNQVQGLKTQVQVASNDISNLNDQLAQVRNNEKESSQLWASITSKAKGLEKK